jgi:hypothetical protein
MKTKYVVLTSKEDTNDYYIVFKSKGLFIRSYYFFKSNFEHGPLDSKIKQVAEGKPMDTIMLRVFANCAGMKFHVMNTSQFFAFML